MLLIFEVLRLFLKTLTAAGKYSLCNIWTLQELIQLQLSKKQKKICQFLKAASNFKHFEKKDDSHSLCISKISDCERHG